MGGRVNGRVKSRFSMSALRCPVCGLAPAAGMTREGKTYLYCPAMDHYVSGPACNVECVNASVVRSWNGMVMRAIAGHTCLDLLVCPVCGFPPVRDGRGRWECVWDREKHMLRGAAKDPNGKKWNKMVSLIESRKEDELYGNR